MLPPLEELKGAIERALAGVSLTIEGAHLVVPSQELIRVCSFLKETPDYQLDYLSNLTAVDYPPDRMDMVYHLFSMAKKHGPVTIRVMLPRANPVVASLVPLYRGAEYQEREVFDLYGVRFEGHPDLRRILMWDEFEGHPMRKDYVPENQDELEGRPSHG